MNWLLVFAPKTVLEYVIAHELAHLKHRSHGKAFWSFLQLMMPSYQKPKAWLGNHQSSLSAGFLRVALEGKRRQDGLPNHGGRRAKRNEQPVGDQRW
ncbi:M48 metallopeptidase family protein [Bradyrhizobium sp. USDA 4452]